MIFAPAPAMSAMSNAINQRTTPAAIIDVGDLLLKIVFTVHQSIQSGKLLLTGNK